MGKLKINKKALRGKGLATKAYQFLANIYRASLGDPNIRPLEEGEIHLPLKFNYCG